MKQESVNCVLTKRPMKIKVCLEMMMWNMDFSSTKLFGGYNIFAIKKSAKDIK